MKFNSADMYEFQRCLRVNNRQFDIPFGVDEFLPAGLACGAVGAVGSTYNYAAPLYHRLIDRPRAGQPVVYGRRARGLVLAAAGGPVSAGND